MARILLSTTSYQDTPGPHHQLLEGAGLEIVRERGPLPEAKMLALAGQFDALLCGDDAITREVLQRSQPRLKYISKYGIGVDKIDIEAATELGIPVSYCPGVNHNTVAEHNLALMLAVTRQLVVEANHVAQGEWKRLTGHETFGKTLGVVGLGRIGQEVVKRASAFGMRLIGFGHHWPAEFAEQYHLERIESFEQFVQQADIISLNTKLDERSRHLVCAKTIALMKDGVVIINTARGGIVHTDDMLAALKSGKVAGYGTDVLDEEPPPADHPLLTAPNCIVTPHIGSRTYESVERQAMMATQNLLNMLDGKAPLAQVNSVPQTVAKAD